MPQSLELDRPSMSAIDTGTREENRVRAEEIHDKAAGQHGTVLRDSRGKLAYPGIVPPEVNSPQAYAKKAPETDRGQNAETASSADLNHVVTDPLPRSQSDYQKPSRASRPSVSKRFGTDARQPNSRRLPLMPSLSRTRTGSALNRALWRPNGLSDDTSSSDDSSSSSDEDNSIRDDEDDAIGGGSSGTRGDKTHPRRRKKRPSSPEQYRHFQVGNQNYSTKGNVSKRDGRLNITVNDTSNTGYLAKALGAAVRTVVTGKDKPVDQSRPTPTRLSSSSTAASKLAPRPKLNIVIMVIGSRGDAQPFLKIGKVLKNDYGHRVRIATHPAFRDFVEKDSGLEFFSVGGDPSELMAFMVKNPGMIPKLETMKAGDIGKRRAAMAEMFDGFWRACINTTDNEKDINNVKMMGEMQPFVADAIIANPPSFAHVHCAEALGIPLHLMFTFPYTPTQAFPHPLATIKRSNVDPGYTNFISYPLVEMMVWQGLGDLVNSFRTKTLGLDPVSTLWAPGSTYRLRVPFSYLWSPGLVPKPPDWGPEIDVSGFVFLDLASSFTPPTELEEFLNAGEPPIYIGFGSIVVDDADRFTEMIFEAVRLAGVRALVSKGWGGLGQGNVPDNIYLLDNVPHDWLFPRVKACVIHGGAGTTAIALKCGKPTMVVPFFGDQHFWGAMVSSSGVGPEPVPYKKLDAEILADGIQYCLTDTAKDAAQDIAKSIELEGDGAKNAVQAFHDNLPLDGEQSMRCSILHDRVAAWSVKNTSIRLSAVAADIAVEKGFISWRKLRPIRHKEWNDFEGPGEPVTGIAGSLATVVGGVFGGIGSVPYRIAKRSHARKERRKQKVEAKKKKKERKAAVAKMRTTNNKNPATGGAQEGFPFPRQSGTATSTNHNDNTNTMSSADGSGNHLTVPDSTHHQPTQQELATAAASVASAATTPATTATGTTAPETGGPLTPAGAIRDQVAEEYLHEIATGLHTAGRALARAPADLSLALAQGFHNAPRLYGDSTVRRPPRVTGFYSGLRAAREEFYYGVYDGFTGVVRLPVRGAKEEGFWGGVAGFGMGITGLVLKNLAALLGPVGYTLKGVVKGWEKKGRRRKGGEWGQWVRRARIVQAGRERGRVNRGGDGGGGTQCLDSGATREEDVVRGWEALVELVECVVAREEEDKKKRRKARVGTGVERGKALVCCGLGSRKNKESDRRKKEMERALRKWGQSRAFGSVEAARTAMERIRKGEAVDVALRKGRVGRVGRWYCRSL